jgi:type IV pilus assembly protein PilN
LLDQLVRQLPEGIHLKTVKQTGQAVSVIGYATSNARVSTLMRNLDASPWLEEPKLIEIKASKVGQSTLNEFNLSVRLTRPKEEAGPGGSEAESSGTKPKA